MESGFKFIFILITLFINIILIIVRQRFTYTNAARGQVSAVLRCVLRSSLKYSTRMIFEGIVGWKWAD